MRHFLAIILLFASPHLYGQNIGELEQQQRATQAEIAKIDAQLKGVSNTKKSTEDKLKLLKRRLVEREKAVANIDSQIEILTSQHDNQSVLAFNNSRRLAELKTKYKDALLLLHKSYLTSGFRSILLSSASREVALRQRYFANVLSASMAAQASQITHLQNIIGVEIGVISSKKERLVELRAASDVELRLIASERRQVEALSAQLGKQHKSLSAQLSEKRRALDGLQREIARAVKAEITASRSAKNAPLSGSFAAAKGRLISPLNGGRVVDSYGIHNHETEKGVKVDNKGINLQSSANSNVRAVFEGEVRRVFVVPGMGRSVLIRHGEYITVYSSLGNVSVVAGDKVKGGQSIGGVGDDGILHFEVWREDATQNPSTWIGSL